MRASTPDRLQDFSTHSEPADRATSTGPNLDMLFSSTSQCDAMRVRSNRQIELTERPRYARRRWSSLAHSFLHARDASLAAGDSVSASSRFSRGSPDAVFRVSKASITHMQELRCVRADRVVERHRGRLLRTCSIQRRLQLHVQLLPVEMYVVFQVPVANCNEA